MKVRIPLRLVSSPNLREHWAVKSKRNKSEMATVGWYLRSEPDRFDLPCRVTITRLGPKPFDRDNNVAAMKATQDAIAEWLGADDSDPRIQWRYAQRRSQDYFVEIEFSDYVDEPDDDEGE